MKGKLFIISGPSGSGKTTLGSHAVKNIGNLKFSVSCTTRPIRKDETDGVDYIFIRENEFQNMIKCGKFAEWAEVHGNLYGTPVKNINDANEDGIDVLLDIDVQGAEQLKNKFPEAVFIFVVPPSIEVLQKRLVKRNSEKQNDIDLRLNKVKYEIAKSKGYDYIIINDDMEKAAGTIESIILFERQNSDSGKGKNKELEEIACRSRSINIYNNIIVKRFDLN